MSNKNVALVVGAGGIIGNALVETLAAHPDWAVRALRRTDVAGVATIDADLHDAVVTRAALRDAFTTPRKICCVPVPNAMASTGRSCVRTLSLAVPPATP